MYQIYIPKLFSALKCLSERELSQAAGISRGTLRQIKESNSDLRLSSLESITGFLGLKLRVIAAPAEPGNSSFSTVATSLKIINDGFSSWKIHLFEMVDEFRRSLDINLLMLPPVSNIDSKLFSLMASVCCALCQEVGILTPEWAAKSYFLSEPWFPSEVESLKAILIIESPIYFRRNNIFVGENFLFRV